VLPWLQHSISSRPTSNLRLTIGVTTDVCFALPLMTLTSSSKKKYAESLKEAKRWVQIQSKPVRLFVSFCNSLLQATSTKFHIYSNQPLKWPMHSKHVVPACLTSFYLSVKGQSVFFFFLSVSGNAIKNSLKSINTDDRCFVITFSI
jgi:hypothetical protein